MSHNCLFRVVSMHLTENKIYLSYKLGESVFAYCILYNYWVVTTKNCALSNVRIKIKLDTIHFWKIQNSRVFVSRILHQISMEQFDQLNNY